MSHYNGFNYEEFYEFIIDFFEDDQTPEGKAATSELFNWWNRYISGSRCTFLNANISVDMYSHSPPPPERPRLYRQGDHRSLSYDDNVKRGHPSKAPSSSFRSSIVFVFI